MIRKCCRGISDLGFPYIQYSPPMNFLKWLLKYPPPVNVPMPIRKALTIDGESKVVDYLLHSEYEITNTSWSKLQNKYNLSKNKIHSTLKGKRRPGGSQYQQKKKLDSYPCR